MILPIMSRGRIRRLDTDDIIMVKAEDKHIVISVERGNSVEEIHTYNHTVKSFAALAGLMPVHRKYAVNLQKIRDARSTQFNTIDLHFTVEVSPIEASRRKAPAVRRALKKPTTSTE